MVLLGATVIVAVGCGGGTQTSSTTSPAASRPSSSHPAPIGAALRPVWVNVVDGDTGRLVAGARVTARGFVRHGASLFTRRHVRSLTVTTWAPHYSSRTVRFALEPSRHLTMRIYRTDGQWLMYGATPARTQFHEGISLRPPFRTVWTKYLGTLLEFPAVIDDGVAYLTNFSGKLFALSMNDGRTLWQRDLNAKPQASSPAVVGSRLVVHAMATGRVVVLDRASGRVLWSRQTSARIESSPAVVDGIDYLGNWAGDIY